MFDPFEILGLEKVFNLDLGLLEQAYFAAQRKVHPDRFTLADEEKKREASHQATLVNQAYGHLKNPLERAAFLLQHKGIPLMTHDPAYLPKVMAWNEALARGEDLKDELAREEAALTHDLEAAFDKNNDEAACAALYRLTYVQKVRK